MPKAEVVTRTDTEYIIDALKSGAITFQDFTDEFVDFVETGGALIDPSFLEGIPFGIISVTYREGFTRVIKGQKFKADYVSLEVMIADETTLNNCGTDWKNRGLKPLDIRIVNDGGTGIRRQMTRYLHTRSYAIITSTIEEQITEGGKLGESDFDIPVGHWVEVLKGEKTKATDDTNVYEVQFDRMVIANRGTRGSKYENPEKKGEIVTTWYLA
jgi:hypothetical protein